LAGVSPEALASLKRATPLGRTGRVDEIWSAVRFAIECDFFTGRVLEVDGGLTMGAKSLSSEGE
jgi:3-oxoacyl-[acyl-carrier protein] reductase